LAISDVMILSAVLEIEYEIEALGGFLLPITRATEARAEETLITRGSEDDFSSGRKWFVVRATDVILTSKVLSYISRKSDKSTLGFNPTAALFIKTYNGWYQQGNEYKDHRKRRLTIESSMFFPNGFNCGADLVIIRDVKLDHLKLGTKSKLLKILDSLFSRGS
jgi:hypothetical protein